MTLRASATPWVNLLRSTRPNISGEISPELNALLMVRWVGISAVHDPGDGLRDGGMALLGVCRCRLGEPLANELLAQGRGHLSPLGALDDRPGQLGRQQDHECLGEQRR